MLGQVALERSPIATFRAAAAVSGDSVATGRSIIKRNDPKIRAIPAGAYRVAFALDVRMLAVFTTGVVFQHDCRDKLIDVLPEIRLGDRRRREFSERYDQLFSCKHIT